MPNDPVEIQYSSPGGTKVKITIDDSQAGFLADKLEAGTGIIITPTEVDGIEKIIISATGAVSDANTHTSIVDFDYTTASPLLLRPTVNGDHVTSVCVAITTAFDGVVSITVGSPGMTDGLHQAIDNLPAQTGQYETWPNFRYTGVDQIQLYITATGSTTGAGVITTMIRTV